MNYSPDQNEERDDLSEEIESMFKDLASDVTASNASYRCPNCGALCANADKGCFYCGSQIKRGGEMSKCESCALFNPNTNIFCGIENPGEPCRIYIPCHSAERLLNLLNESKRIADQICKEHKDCSGCEMRYSGVRHGCVSDSIETAIEKIKFNIEHEVNK